MMSGPHLRIVTPEITLVDDLLVATAEPSPETGDVPAVETWETEGGPEYQRA